MKIKIVSPEKQLYSAEDATEVYIPTQTGIIGILPDHENLISLLKIGEIRVKRNSNPADTILINSGILQVKDNEIIILADEAHLPDELVKEEIEKAIKMAEEKIAKNPSSTELILLEKQLLYQRFKQSKVRL